MFPLKSPATPPGVPLQHAGAVPPFSLPKSDPARWTGFGDARPCLPGRPHPYVHKGDTVLAPPRPLQPGCPGPHNTVNPRPPRAPVHFTAARRAPRPWAAGAFRDGGTSYQGSETAGQEYCPPGIRGHSLRPQPPACALRNHLPPTWTPAGCQPERPALPWGTPGWTLRCSRSRGTAWRRRALCGPQRSQSVAPRSRSHSRSRFPLRLSPLSPSVLSLTPLWPEVQRDKVHARNQKNAM